MLVEVSQCYIGKRDHEDCNVDFIGKYDRNWHIVKDDKKKTTISFFYCRTHETEFKQRRYIK